MPTWVGTREACTGSEPTRSVIRRTSVLVVVGSASSFATAMSAAPTEASSGLRTSVSAALASVRPAALGAVLVPRAWALERVVPPERAAVDLVDRVDEVDAVELGEVVRVVAIGSPQGVIVVVVVRRSWVPAGAVWWSGPGCRVRGSLIVGRRSSVVGRRSSVAHGSAPRRPGRVAATAGRSS
ncbi:exported hypothetical protein [Frankia sp. AgKG'84/4]